MFEEWPFLVRRSGRAVHGTGFENRRSRKATGGSNPSSSAAALGDAAVSLRFDRGCGGQAARRERQVNCPFRSSEDSKHAYYLVFDFEREVTDIQTVISTLNGCLDLVEDPVQLPAGASHRTRRSIGRPQ